MGISWSELQETPWEVVQRDLELFAIEQNLNRKPSTDE